MTGGSDAHAPDPALIEAVAHATRVAAGFLAAFEHSERHLHPPELPRLRDGLARIGDALRDAATRLRDAPHFKAVAPLLERLDEALALAIDAVELFVAPGTGPDAAPSPARLLGSLRSACRAREALYPLRRVLPLLGLSFAEPALHDRLDALDPDPAPESTQDRVGLHTAALDGPDARGGFVLYVPESWDGARALPLVVALHGAYGFGQDFVWTWLREARSRGCLLLAPTSPDPTWSLHAPGRDGARLDAMLQFVRSQWPVDAEHVLLTGLSDGATFALLHGLAEGSPFTHLAPVSGVLHPMSFTLGNLARAAGRPIWLAHGALDWMFPIALARAARDALTEAGAQLVYREITDLSHTYPREENARILRWMDPRLALPGDPT